MKKELSLFGITYRAWYVWRRNLDVALVTWKTSVFPPMLEPVFYILAFGLGLGAYVGKISYMGRECAYLPFIAPGMVAVGILFHSVFECMYASFVRMYYQKTYDAIISTPLSAEDVLGGEILWGATKGLFAGTAILAIVSLFGLVNYPSALIILPAAVVAGLLFSGMGLLFASKSPSIDNLNLPVFLFINPMFLFSGTFFPLDGLPLWAKYVAYALPLAHLTDICRAATLGVFYPALLLNWLYLVALAATLPLLSVREMRKRLIK